MEPPADEPFKATIFRKLYVSSRSSTKYGFLAATLRAEGILLPVEKAVYSHIESHVAAFIKATLKSVKDNVSLEDVVARHNAEMEARRQALAEKMRKAGNGKAAAKDTAKTK